MRILYFHVPTMKPYMVPTMELMAGLVLKGYRVVEIVTPPGQCRMYEGLVENWGIEDLIIFGQDNTCDLQQLEDLIICKYPICAIPCIVHPRTTGLPGLYLNQMDRNGKLLPVDSKEEYGYVYMGTGLCKISLSLQQKIGSISNMQNFHHQSFDTNISNLSIRAGIQKFHLHYPLHQHWKIGDVYEPRV